MERCTKRPRLDHKPIDRAFIVQRSQYPRRPKIKGELICKIDSDANLAQKRALLDKKLQATFESIFEKYGKDFQGIGDEIDIATGKIVVDNGHVLHMKNEKDAGILNYSRKKKTKFFNRFPGGTHISLWKDDAEQDLRGERVIDGEKTTESRHDCDEDDVILRGLIRVNQFQRLSSKEVSHHKNRIIPENYLEPALKPFNFHSKNLSRVRIPTKEDSYNKNPRLINNISSHAVCFEKDFQLPRRIPRLSTPPATFENAVGKFRSVESCTLDFKYSQSLSSVNRRASETQDLLINIDGHDYVNSNYYMSKNRYENDRETINGVTFGSNQNIIPTKYNLETLMSKKQSLLDCKPQEYSSGNMESEKTQDFEDICGGFPSEICEDQDRNEEAISKVQAIQIKKKGLSNLQENSGISQLEGLNEAMEQLQYDVQFVGLKQLQLPDLISDSSEIKEPLVNSIQSAEICKHLTSNLNNFSEKGEFIKSIDQHITSTPLSKNRYRKCGNYRLEPTPIHSEYLSQLIEQNNYPYSSHKLFTNGNFSKGPKDFITSKMVTPHLDRSPDLNLAIHSDSCDVVERVENQDKSEIYLGTNNTKLNLEDLNLTENVRIALDDSLTGIDLITEKTYAQREAEATCQHRGCSDPELPKNDVCQPLSSSLLIGKDISSGQQRDFNFISISENYVSPIELKKISPPNHSITSAEEHLSDKSKYSSKKSNPPLPKYNYLLTQNNHIKDRQKSEVTSTMRIELSQKFQKSNFKQNTPESKGNSLTKGARFNSRNSTCGNGPLLTPASISRITSEPFLRLDEHSITSFCSTSLQNPINICEEFSHETPVIDVLTIQDSPSCRLTRQSRVSEKTLNSSFKKPEKDGLDTDEIENFRLLPSNKKHLEDQSFDTSEMQQKFKTDISNVKKQKSNLENVKQNLCAQLGAGKGGDVVAFGETSSGKSSGKTRSQNMPDLSKTPPRTNLLCSKPNTFNGDSNLKVENILPGPSHQKASKKLIRKSSRLEEIDELSLDFLDRSPLLFYKSRLKNEQYTKSPRNLSLSEKKKKKSLIKPEIANDEDELGIELIHSS